MQNFQSTLQSKPSIDTTLLTKSNVGFETALFGVSANNTESVETTEEITTDATTSTPSTTTIPITTTTTAVC
jgi:hypothetical protein